MKKNIIKIIYSLSRLKFLYRLSAKVVNCHRDENNCEIETNGELNFIKKHGSKFTTIFDVGANIGEWSNLVSKVIPKSHIYSFEPSLKTFKILKQNITSTNVSVFNLGLGDTNQTVDFYINNNDSTLNSTYNRAVEIENHEIKTTVENAQFVTLDSFCKKEKISDISFLKIDTEGHELSVLKGATDFITNGKINAIQFEYGGTYIDAHILLRDIYTFFHDKPYKIYKINHFGLKECFVYKQDLENFQYANYVALLNKS